MSGEAGNPHTGLEIGRTLELTREKRGLSLQQVEEATKIRTRYLRDLENENFEVLPAVYMLGSLKSYAEYLGLDGAAMTTELKRRQASLQADQLQEVLEEPSPDESPGLLASLARLIGIGETAEDEAGAMSDRGRSPGLYVSLAVVLVFILATYLASILEGEVQPAVSQVREPKTLHSPSGVALIGNAVADERSNTEAGKRVTQPEEQADASAEDDEAMAKSDGGAETSPRTAQASSSATASASVPASAPASTPASASAASSESVPAASPASAPATAKPVPVVRPEPVAKKRPAGAGGGRKVATAPTRRPAHVPGNPRIRKTKVIPVGAPRLDNRSPTKVTKVIKSAR